MGAPVMTPSTAPVTVTFTMTRSMAMVEMTRSTEEAIQSTAIMGAIPSSVDLGRTMLTGSNGDDRFVYLSVADSNAAQFDTISDFKSGSDRINLTALGALGLSILALTSTSTSVPAHTIAWLYDSAANETIVYVNPTDHTLSIGDSGLLEIHLQGIATIQASDFIYERDGARRGGRRDDRSCAGRNGGK